MIPGGFYWLQNVWTGQDLLRDIDLNTNGATHPYLYDWSFKD